MYNNRTWDKISNKMKNLQKYIFDKVLLEVIEFCQQSKKTNDSTIVPTCALVTGVNLPDHTALFKVCAFYLLQAWSSDIFGNFLTLCPIFFELSLFIFCKVTLGSIIQSGHEKKTHNGINPLADRERSVWNLKEIKGKLWGSWEG